jgi:hypothetical protein
MRLTTSTAPTAMACAAAWAGVLVKATFLLKPDQNTCIGDVVQMQRNCLLFCFQTFSGTKSFENFSLANRHVPFGKGLVVGTVKCQASRGTSGRLTFCWIAVILSVDGLEKWVYIWHAYPHPLFCVDTIIQGKSKFMSR